MAYQVNGTAMFRHLLMGATSLLLMACNTAPAQPTANKDIIPSAPAIWTVSDADTTLHLFGFAQVLPPETEWRSAEFNTLFKNADRIVLESNSANPEAQQRAGQMIQQIGMNPEGVSLTDILPDEEAVTEVASLAESLGVPLQALGSMKPWLASVQLGVVAVARQGYDLQNGPATVIAAEAASAGKPIIALEGPTDLLERMADFPLDEQVEMLMHTVRQVRDDPKQIERANTAWLTGDVETLGDVLHGQEGAWSSDAVYQVALVDRNREWASEIDALMRDHTGSIFVAVGMGHLAGDDSLVTMLSDGGLTVNRRHFETGNE